MRSFSSAFCSSESLFTPTCCRHDRLHGDGAGPPQHPPVNWQIKYIHSISCTSARATGDKIKSSQDHLPVGACLFQNGFYVAPEFSCVTGCKEVGFRNSILPKRWSCGNHPLLPPSCHGSSKSMRGLVRSSGELSAEHHFATIPTELPEDKATAFRETGLAYLTRYLPLSQGNWHCLLFWCALGSSCKGNWDLYSARHPLWFM